MDPISKSRIKFTLEFRSVNDATMRLVLRNNDQEWTFDPGKDMTIEHEIETNLPTDIHLTISGKNMLTDTLLNENGQIIKDKYVKISSIDIDGISVPVPWLEKKIVLNNLDQQSVASNYFGHNGTCLINFPKSNAFLQILSLNREI